MAKTELDRIAAAYVDTVVRLSPMTATDIGADGDHAALDDFSPAGLAARAEAAREALRASGKFLPWQVVTISVDGKILDC